MRIPEEEVVQQNLLSRIRKYNKIPNVKDHPQEPQDTATTVSPNFYDSPNIF